MGQKPEWVEHECPNCHRALLIDRLSLTVIRKADSREKEQPKSAPVDNAGA